MTLTIVRTKDRKLLKVIHEQIIEITKSNKSVHNYLVKENINYISLNNDRLEKYHESDAKNYIIKTLDFMVNDYLKHLAHMLLNKLYKTENPNSTRAYDTLEDFTTTGFLNLHHSVKINVFQNKDTYKYYPIYKNV